MRKVVTYERLHRHILAWTKLQILRLALFGPPGIGKSHAYKDVLGNRPHNLFGGRQSPLHVYKALCDAPHVPVVLDDISALLKDDNFRDMLKNLTETGQRVIRWGTTTSKLEGRPTSFVCTAPVLIVLNKLPKNDPDVEAILDRCDAIWFEPTKEEIIARMRELFPENADLIDLIAELPALPSLRTLVHARDWQNSDDLDVMEELLSECGASSPITRLLEIMEAFPETEWCRRYVQQTGLTDRTYRRHKYYAEQLFACRKSPSGCPSVRPVAPSPVSEGGDGAVNEPRRPDGQATPDGQGPSAAA